MTDLEIAAYLDRGLSSAERDRLENHLAECAECRRHVAEVHQVLRRARRPRRLVVGAALLAAAVAFVLIVKPEQIRPGAATLERAGNNEPTLLAYGPSGEVARAQLRFVWGSAPNSVSYRLTVTSADGSPVWSASTADTVATAPANAAFTGSEKYFWVVDAILADGTTRSTGLREFKPVQ